MIHFGRDSHRTSGVGSPEVTEAERRISGVVTYGVVTEIDYSDTSNPVVRVGIGDPEDDGGYIETGWIPMGTTRSNEWDPLKVGESVRVTADDGELQNGVVCHAIHNAAHVAPGNRPDLWRKNLGNGFLQYDEATDTLTLDASQGGTIVLAAGGCSITLSAGGIKVVAPGVVEVDAPMVTTEGNVRAGTGATVAITTPTGQVLHFQNGILTGVN